MNADYQRCRSWSQPIKSFCYSFTQGGHDWCASVRVSQRKASSAVLAAPLFRLRMSSREVQGTPTMSLSAEGLPDHKIRSLRVGFCRKQWTKRPCLLRDTLLGPLLTAFHTRLHWAQGSASNSNRNKLLYLHYRIILQYCSITVLLVDVQECTKHPDRGAVKGIHKSSQTQQKVSGYKTNPHGMKIKMRKILLLAGPFPCKRLHFYVARPDDGGCNGGLIFAGSGSEKVPLISNWHF